MSCLRLLILNNANFPRSLNYLFEELRHLERREYLFTYLPSSFKPNKHLELILLSKDYGKAQRKYKLLFSSFFSHFANYILKKKE